MSSVILVPTVHRPIGNCNPDELFKIIEAIAPEVIFEEIPPNKFSAIYQGKRADSLETTTVKRYLQKYPVVHLPVDMMVEEETEMQIRREVLENVLPFIAYNSPEYQYLEDLQRDLVKRMGVKYLNSDQFRRLSDRKHFLEKEILKKCGDNRPYELYDKWGVFNDTREDEMIRSIYKYSEDNGYERGLFLVGAEHKNPIIDKIQKLETTAREKVSWVFDYL